MSLVPQVYKLAIMVPENFKLKENDKRGLGKSRLGIIGPLVNFGDLTVSTLQFLASYTFGPWVVLPLKIKRTLLLKLLMPRTN